MPHTITPSRAGFSLVELVLVIAILGVFAAMAAPRYGGAVDRFRADAAARRVASDVALAQSRARSSSRSVSIRFDVNGGTYQLDGEADPDRPNRSYVVDLTGAPYRASILSGSFKIADTVSFNGYGVPTSDGSLTLSSGSVKRTVVINPETGTASIQ